MTGSDQAIRRQLQLGEDSHWEFKQIEFDNNAPKSPRRDALADELAAFANASGGILLCGVTDSGDIQGMSRSQMDALERLVVEICSDSIQPPISPEISRTEIDNKPLLVVEVEAGYAQHDSPGGSYQRIGSSKRRMTPDARLRLAQQRGQSRFLWFDKQPVPDTGFETLHDRLWKPMVTASAASDPPLALQNLRLLTQNASGVHQATVAGILLCTDSPQSWFPNACIMATRYRGTDRASGQWDTQEIVGPLPRQIADAVQFVVRNMQVAARKTPARIDVPQYSVEAVFEAIVNAVAHRDYSIQGQRIRLSIFEDRMEIDSPGALPNGMTIANMEASQSTRNDIIASVFGRLPVGTIAGSEKRQFLMERRGDGVSIIRRTTQETSGALPVYELMDDVSLRLIIPAANLEATPARPTITVRNAGQPLPGVEVLALFPNKTWKRALTNEYGEAQVDLHSTHLPMTVFAATAGFAGHVESEWRPDQGALSIDLAALRHGGSVIFSEATGDIPGLQGRLNPIRDTHDRIYLHASKIAINQGRQQPVHLLLGEELRLTDADGNEKLVVIREIVGRSALLDYRPLSSPRSGESAF